MSEDVANQYEIFKQAETKHIFNSKLIGIKGSIKNNTINENIYLSQQTII